MPRSPEKSRELRDASRESILRVALALFAKVGYERTSVRMIARAAGVSQGLMYNYFESKEALLRAIVERNMADVQVSFARAGDAASPQEGLAKLVYASLEVVRENMDFWRLSYALRTQPLALGSLGDEVPEMAAAIRRELEGYFRGLGTPRPEVEAAILFALIDGVAQHYVLAPDSYPLQAVLDTIVGKYASPEARERKRP